MRGYGTVFTKRIYMELKRGKMYQNRNEKTIDEEIDEQVCIPEIVSKGRMERKRFNIAAGYVRGWTYEIHTHVNREGIVNKGIGSFGFRVPGICAGFSGAYKETEQ